MRRGRSAGRWPAALVLVTLLASGCSILGPRPDRSRFYTLVPAPAGAGKNPADGLAGRTIGIGPVKLPGYLQRHEIASRVSPTRIQYSPLALWAEPLSQNITRVLQADLAADSGAARVVVWPWLEHVDYQVVVEVARFEVGSPPGANLDARWTVRLAPGGDVLASGEASIRRAIEGRGTTDEVAALSAALSDFAQQLGAALRNAARKAAATHAPPEAE